MAEEEEAEQAEDAEGGDLPPEDEGGGSRLPQFIVLIFVILIGQGAAAFYLIKHVYYPGLIEEPEEEGEAAPARERPVFEIDEPLLHTMEEMVMNPPDDEGIRFLTARVTLELDTPEALAVFDDPLSAAQAHDLVFGVLTKTRFEHMDEAEDRTKVKQKLKEELNASPLFEELGEVTNVYFERFVLQ